MRGEEVKIDLKLPRNWNDCSLFQLRAIADILVGCAMRQSRYRQFSIDDVKIACFIRLSGIEIIKGVDASLPVEEQCYLCRLLPYTLDDEHRWHGLYPRWQLFRRWVRKCFGKEAVTFPLYLWQIQSWLTPQKHGRRTLPGKLDWLDTTNGNQLLAFPFPSVRCRKGRVGGSIVFHGPNLFMDGFTWQRYRFCQDYMEAVRMAENRLVQLTQQYAVLLRRRPHDRADRKKQGQATRTLIQQSEYVQKMHAHFLATIFIRKVRYADAESGRRKRDFQYQAGQSVANMKYFLSFSQKDWQLVALWWQGMMHWLSTQYPKVFKTSKVENKKPVNPMEVYTRTTATLEKYLHTTAAALDNEPYTTVLQQLNDIMVRNEEFERINREMKK
jgi:hypothetical protein